MTASIFSSITNPSWLWFWESLEFISIIIVGIGCWGEVWAEHHKFSAKPNDLMPSNRINKQLEKVFWLMVVWGLAIELVSFGFAFLASNKEIESLNKKAGDAWTLAAKIGTTNAQLVTDNLVLRSNVMALELKVKPRSVDWHKIKEYRVGLKPETNDLVIIKFFMADKESLYFAQDLRRLFVSSGYSARAEPVTESSLVLADIPINGIVIMFSNSRSLEFVQIHGLFWALGFPPETIFNPLLKPNEVIIFVGHKSSYIESDLDGRF